MIVGIGADICSVERMQRMIERHGGRFLGRVFSEAEQARCASAAGAAERFAARFAAKEATMKALGTGWALGVRFADIHVETEAGGRPVVRLTGPAAERAQRMGVDAIHVSLSHERDQAIAFVVLESHQSPTPTPVSL
jgi:holo-[acyl-carrier protein] synthase